jgi:hypothetical protein
MLLRLLIRNWLVACCSRALPACTRRALRVLRWVPLLLHRLHRLPLCQLAELLVSRSPRPRVARSLSLRLLVRLNLRRRDRRANLGGRSLSTSVEGLQLADGLHRRLSSGTYEVLVPSKYPRMARCETEANWSESDFELCLRGSKALLAFSRDESRPSTQVPAAAYPSTAGFTS